MNSQVLAILRTLSPGTNVQFQFDSFQAFTTGVFQNINGNTVAINVGGTVFYFLADRINAIAPLT